ncbi:hypothetical protein SNEBB_008339 [Seison nebaliae]|nr:hypothetical protein SNEBB_008339 [Seison nebaliae]
MTDIDEDIYRVFHCAGNAFQSLSVLIKDLNEYTINITNQTTPKYVKWTTRDVEELRGAILRFSDDLEMITSNMKDRANLQIKESLRKRAESHIDSSSATTTTTTTHRSRMGNLSSSMNPSSAYRSSSVANMYNTKNDPVPIYNTQSTSNINNNGNNYGVTRDNDKYQQPQHVLMGEGMNNKNLIKKSSIDHHHSNYPTNNNNSTDINFI